MEESRNEGPGIFGNDMTYSRDIPGRRRTIKEAYRGSIEDGEPV